MKLLPMTKAKLWVRSFVFGENCVACGKSETHGESFLCSDCERKLQRSRYTVCMNCGHYVRDCLCTSSRMLAEGCDYLIKYAFYDPSDPSAPLNKIIHRLKRYNDRIVCAYFAAVLSVPLSNLISLHGFTHENTEIVYIPRSRRKIRIEGHDQARTLAHAISNRCGIGMKNRLVSLDKKNVQKKLDSGARMDNVKDSFKIRRPREIKGKNIILVDDLVTTGATAAECVKILRKAGAAEVVAVAVARSQVGSE